MPDPNEAELRSKIWEQVWTQSRHLEGMRSQYLGFFFTALLAITAVAGKGLADHQLATDASLVTFALLLAGLQLLTGFLLMAIRRIGMVLLGYSQSIKLIRQSMADPQPAWAELPERSTSGLLSTQRAAESVLWASLVLFAAALLASAVRAVTVSVGEGTQVVCWLAFMLAATVTAICAGARPESQATPESRKAADSIG